MIVGGYTLDLYCAREDKCKNAEQYQECPPSSASIAGETNAECRREARRRGWVFTRDGDVLCPKCSGKKTNWATSA